MILLLDERQRKELAQYSPYIAIPKVSSQNRRYIPMDYLEGEIIPGDKLFTMPSATSYEFGILMSNVHMAWTRAVCGRLKSDYSYSNMIVYNNFPWPSPTNDQKEKIRKTAQAILNARALYTDSNLAELNVVQMVENMRDQAMPNGVIINDAYCDRSMTRDYDREGLNAFFATLKEEDFEVVVVRSLNEITDDIHDLEEFVNTITDMGIWLYSLEVGPVPITVSVTHFSFGLSA